jgi:hypothetical protein
MPLVLLTVFVLTFITLPPSTSIPHITPPISKNCRFEPYCTASNPLQCGCPAWFWSISTQIVVWASRYFRPISELTADIV